MPSRGYLFGRPKIDFRECRGSKLVYVLNQLYWSMAYQAQVWDTRQKYQISKSGCKKASTKNLSVRQKFHNSLNIKTLGLGMSAHALSLFPVPLLTTGSYGNVE